MRGKRRELIGHVLRWRYEELRLGVEPAHRNAVPARLPVAVDDDEGVRAIERALIERFAFDDMSVREGIKAYSNWPTIPQLYVKGEFIGGCDIVREMFQAGELQDLLTQKGVAHNSQTLTA